jgi:hypothetical protein
MYRDHRSRAGEGQTESPSTLNQIEHDARIDLARTRAHRQTIERGEAHRASLAAIAAAAATRNGRSRRHASLSATSG